MLGSTSADTSADIVVDARWNAIEATFGGYVVHLAASAIESIRPDLTPISLTVEFLGSLRPGDAQVTAGLLHSGRQSATATAAILQGHPKMIALGKFLSTNGVTEWGSATDLTTVQAPEALTHLATPYGHLQWEELIELRRVDKAIHPTRSVEGWVRILPEAFPGVSELSAFVAAPLLLDVLPSGLYGLEPYPRNVPTVEFTLHAAPARITVGDWYFISQRLPWSSVDVAIEEQTLYARSGAFVAATRQTRRVVRDD